MKGKIIWFQLILNSHSINHAFKRPHTTSRKMLSLKHTKKKRSRRVPSLIQDKSRPPPESRLLTKSLNFKEMSIQLKQTKKHPSPKRPQRPQKHGRKKSTISQESGRSKSSKSSNSNDVEPFQVYVRIRPLNKRECEKRQKGMR